MWRPGDALDVWGSEQYPKRTAATRRKSEKQKLLLSTDGWDPPFAVWALNSRLRNLQLTQLCCQSSCWGPTPLQSRALCLKMSTWGKEKRNTSRSLLLASKCNFYFTGSLIFIVTTLSHFTLLSSPKPPQNANAEEHSLSPRRVSLLPLFFPWRYLLVPRPIPISSLEEPWTL